MLIVSCIHLILYVLYGLNCLEWVVYWFFCYGRFCQGHLVKLAGSCVKVKNILFIKIMKSARIEWEDLALIVPKIK